MVGIKKARRKEAKAAGEKYKAKALLAEKPAAGPKTGTYKTKAA